MKFRDNMIKKMSAKIISAAVLAAALTVWSLPCGALAAAPEKTENSVESDYEKAGDNMENPAVISEEKPESKAQETNGNAENEPEDDQENGGETENMPEDDQESDGEIEDEPDSGHETPAEVPFYMKDPVTGIIVEADAGIVPAGVIAVIVSVEGREEAEQLGQFLALSSDRYTAYYITLIDFMTMTPVVPSGDLKISIPVPEDYDMSKVAVSTVVLQGESPQRTEINADFTGDMAVFATDQTGLFAVMEKKVMPELPSALEMTGKVEKLELASRHQNLNLTSSYTAFSSSIKASPATGDETNAVTWAVLAVAAVLVAAAVVVIIIIRNRKR